MSVALGQEQLLEDAPEHAIIVPRAGFGHWGVDPSTKRVSIAWIGPDGERGVETESFPAPREALRLTAIRELTYRFAGDLQHTHPAGFVFVEQPSGKQITLALTYAVGCIVEAIQAALVMHTDGFVPVVGMVSSSSWKKIALGRGDVYKPKKDDPRPYYALTWAQERGYRGRLWDEADAYGIAEAARKTAGFIVR
jgi:hypothetical protein